MSEHPETPGVRQERDRVPTLRLLLLLVGMFVLMAMGAGAAFWMLRAQETGLRPGIAIETPPHTRTPPRIDGVHQTLVGTDTATRELHERKWRELNSYGWTNRERGLAHIPIGEAMRRVAGGAR